MRRPRWRDCLLRRDKIREILRAHTEFSRIAADFIDRSEPVHHKMPWRAAFGHYRTGQLLKSRDKFIFKSARKITTATRSKIQKFPAANRRAILVLATRGF